MTLMKLLNTVFKKTLSNAQQNGYDLAFDEISYAANRNTDVVWSHPVTGKAYIFTAKPYKRTR